MAEHDHQIPPRLTPASGGRFTSHRRPRTAVFPAVGDSPGWMSRGACRAEDPELFFPIATTGPALAQARMAKAICGRCPVQPDCLSYALVTRQGYGIWGGTTTEERWQAHHQPRRRTTGSQ